MKQIEVFRWLVPSPNPRGRPRITSYFLSREEAAVRYPGAEPVLSTLKLQPVYESRDEANGARGNIGAGIVAAGGGPKRLG